MTDQRSVSNGLLDPAQVSTPNEIPGSAFLHDQKYQVRAKSHSPGANRKRVDARALEADISHRRLCRKAKNLQTESLEFIEKLRGRIVRPQEDVFPGSGKTIKEAKRSG